MAKSHIEKKVPISADAAIKVQEYLEAICLHLSDAGLSNIFEITKSFEDNIIGRIERLGLGKKVSLEDVMIILNALGTPSRVVENYLKENNITKRATTFTFVNSELTKRDGELRSLLLSLTLIGLISLQMIMIITFIFKLIFLEYAFLFLIGSFLIFVIIELYSGLTGTIFLSKTFMIHYRKGFQYTISMISIILLSLYISFLNRARYTEEFFDKSSYDNFSVYLGTKQQFYGFSDLDSGIIKDHFYLLAIIILFVFIIPLTRDNLPCFYPLSNSNERMFLDRENILTLIASIFIISGFYYTTSGLKFSEFSVLPRYSYIGYDIITNDDIYFYQLDKVLIYAGILYVVAMFLILISIAIQILKGKTTTEIEYYLNFGLVIFTIAICKFSAIIVILATLIGVLTFSLLLIQYFTDTELIISTLERSHRHTD